MIKGAIFDLDGTLLDSMYIWEEIAKDYLLSRGVSPHERLNEKLKNMSLKQGAQYYQREYGLTDSVKDIMNGINSMIEHFYTDEVLPKPGVLNFLRKLQSMGIKMCIATATDRHLVEAALERTQLRCFFGEIFTCTAVGFGKDDRAIYDAAMEFLGTSKDETIVFEDALHAIETAKNAGYTIAAVYDRSAKPNQDRIKSLSDYYILSFEEMEVL